MYAELAIEALTRPTRRDRQRSLGPSDHGDCHARAWHKIHGSPVTNTETDRLASSMGTAIHTALADGMRKADPFGDRFLIEVPVTRDGLSGTCDLFDKETGAVVDWKTTTKKALGASTDWPAQAQRWQVHLYGWMLAPIYDVRTVVLVGIARDGGSSHIRQHDEPYDPAIALEALAWADAVAAAPEPIPQRNARYFCSTYCEFFDATGETGCPGRTER